MKICIVVSNLDYKTGWGRLASQVADKMIDQGHELGFILERGESAKSRIVLTLRCPWYKKLFLFIPNLFKIRKFLKDYDTVLCYDINPYALILNLATLGQDKKIVVHILGTYSLFSKKDWFRNMWMRWAYNKSSYILVVSRFLKRQVEKFGYQLKNYTFVPVGVDIKHFRVLENPKKILKYPFIISVGAIKHRKGFHLSIKAFSLIANKFPEIKYVIVGSKSDQDPYYQGLKTLIKDLNLEDRVVFMSGLSDDDLVDLYNIAELFVLTPITTDKNIEGFGMVYLEAGSCGRPVVGTLDTGAEEAIEDGLTGFLVPHDENKIAEAMIKILSNKDLAEKFGQQGIARAKKYNWDNVVKLYLDNFLKVNKNK